MNRKDVPFKRTFDGKWYYSHTAHASKSLAEDSAITERGRGYCARVVKFSKGYAVYIRDKRYRNTQ